MAYLNGKELLFSPHVHIDPASKTKLQAAREEGKQSFLDEYQQHGARTDYSNAFAGPGWNNDNFKPRYNLTLKSGYMLFRGSNIEGDLVDILNKRGITIDFTNCTNFQYTFSRSKITRIGEIDTKRGNSLSAFAQDAAQLQTIDKLILPDSGVTSFGTTFNNTPALENITIEGVIGKDISFKDSTKLSRSSIESVVNALSDSVEGKPTVTFSKTAVENAFPKVDCLAYAVYAESQTKDGLTITNNGDGSFTLNGTYNGTDGFPLFFNVATIDLPFATYGTYILSLEGGKVDGIEDVYTRGGLNLMWGENPLEKPRGDTIYMDIVISPGATFDNGTIHPTLVCDEWHTLIYHPNHFWTISLV